MILSRSLFISKLPLLLVAWLALLVAAPEITAPVAALADPAPPKAGVKAAALAFDIKGELRFAAAKCNGELRSPSNEFGSAPHSSKSFRTSVDGNELSVWFLMIEEESRDDAKCKRVEFLLFFGFNLINS